MDDFQVARDSLGNWSVANLPGVVEVRIYADEKDRSAHMEICLEQDTWQARDAVIDEMVEIEAMFFDDFAITYSFGESRSPELAAVEGLSTRTFAAV
ncbi:hypothetical protein [Isoptericola nanjingensis]|uniref:hypothetical protein n=1 Tax=Isoptericola nanjingensis TaxID=903413 RepID=UPI003D234DF5